MAVNTGSFSAPKAEPVHFTEAIEFLRNKVRLPTRAWTDLWQDQHSRAFVVAGAMKDELVGDFHEAVTKAIAEGRTLADFRKDFDRIVDTHGWSYKGGREWRSRTIFEANMRTAYGAGRWAQTVRNSATRPYVRYVHGHPLHPRPLHLSWHNTFLRWDDPWWKTHWAPNGWGCQCITQSVSEADMKRNGWKVSKSAPAINLVRHEINTPDGVREIFVPEGIDPGFGYNPGEGAFGRGPNRKALEEHSAFEELVAPSSMRHDVAPLAPVPTTTKPLPRVALLDGKPDETALRDTLRKAIGGDEAIFTDPAGGRVAVTQALADHIIENPSRLDGREAYWPYIRELIEAPQEIWVGFAQNQDTGLVRLRRRYVKLIEVKDGRILALVADEQSGYWQALTFMNRAELRKLDAFRVGVLAYKAAQD